MQDDCINYMHFGGALQHHDSMPWRHLRGVRRKSEVLSTIRADNTANTDLIALVRSYGPSRCKRFDIERFQFELGRTLIYQTQFKTLGCRGFSYCVKDDIEFPDPFAKHITLRLVLPASRENVSPASHQQPLFQRWISLYRIRTRNKATRRLVRICSAIRFSNWDTFLREGPF